MNRIERTHFHAAAESETAVITCLWSAVRHEGQHTAVLNPAVIIVHSRALSIALTSDKSDLPDTFPRFHAHDLCYLISYCFTAHGTGVDGCLSLGNSGRQPGAARITASSAVIARQNTQNRLFFLINFHFKLNAGNSQKQSDKQPNRSHDQRRHQYSVHIQSIPFAYFTAVRRIRRMRSPSAQP